MSKVIDFLHKIQAYLFPNHLTDNPDDLSARVSSARSLDVHNICQQAVKRGGAATSVETMEMNVGLFHKEMAYQLANGIMVNTGYYTAVAKINGVFDKASEKFNPEKHQLSFQFNQGYLLRQEIPYIDVEILGLGDSSAFIDQVTDVKSNTVNDLLTPERPLRISGYKLKISGELEENGVYFINQATQERTKVDKTDIVTNNPSELVVVIPALSAGEYKMEVVTQFSGNSAKPLKEAKRAVFDKSLVVE